MKRILLIAFLTYFSFNSLSAQDYTAQSDGNWETAGNWDVSPPSLLDGQCTGGEDYLIQSNITRNGDIFIEGASLFNWANFDVDGNLDVLGNFETGVFSSVNVTADDTLLVDGNTTFSTGVLDIDLGGTMITTGDFDLGVATLFVDGLFIVLGDFIGDITLCDFDGQVVVVGDWNTTNSLVGAEDSALYVFGDVSASPPISGNVGNQDSLNAHHPGIADFLDSLINQYNCLVLPTASITSPGTEINCSVSDINLDGSTSTVQNGTPAYSWTTADGNIVSGATSAIANIDAAGTYELEITDTATYCSDVETIVITENTTLPTPTLSSDDADNIICAGDQVIFTGGGGTNYEFRLNYVTVQNGAGTTYTTSTLNNGDAVKVIVTNGNGCIDSTAAITTTVNALPTPTLSSDDADNIICDGDQVIFTAGGGTNYEFRLNYVTVQNGAGTTYTTTTLNNGDAVKVIVTNGNGCIDSTAAITTTVNALPTPTLSSDDADNIICDGDQVIFTAGGGTNYEFRLNYVTVQNGAGTTYTTTGLSNGDAVKVIVTNGNGCIDSTAAITTTVNALPTPTLSSDDADNIICAGDQVIFTAGGGTNYEFRLNYVTVQNGAGTTYTTTGLSNGDAVKVIVTNGNGCIDSTAAIATTVNALPTPTLSSDDADNIICAGDQVIFTAGGGTNYEFRLNYVTVQNGAGTTYTTTGLSNGDAVKVIVTNGNGCIDSTAAITTTVNALPTPTLSSDDADNIICDGDQVIFTAGGGTNYEFRLNYVTVQNGAGTTYTTTTLNNGDAVKVIVTNGNGCIDSTAAITTTVNALPTPTLSSDDADNIICDGDQVIFTAGGGTNYEFRLNYVTVQNGAGTTYTTTTLNNGDAVKVIVTNGNGCIDSTAAITTTVNALPTPTLSSDDADNIICDGDQVIFTAGGGTNYEFRLNYVTVQNGAGTTYTTTGLSNGDAVKVIVTNGNGCIDSTAAITTTVNALPTPTLSSDDADNIICDGDQVIFTAGGGTNYEFRLNYVTVQNGAGTTYTTTGLSNGDAVKVIVTNGNGCIDSTAAITTTVNALPTPTLSSDDADNIICDGDQVIFTAGGGINYEFRLNYVTVQNGAGTTYTTTGLSNGDAVKVIVTNGNGCIDSTAAITTTVNALPTPTLSSDDADNIICDGDQVIFTGGGGTNYEFRLNYVTVQNGAGTTYTTSTLNNSDAVKVIVTNANGCIDSTAAITTTVNALPTPTLSSDDADNIICDGDQVIFTAGGGTNYEFRLNYVTIQNGVGTTYTTTTLSDGDAVKVIVTNANGCIDSTAAITTTVNALPTPTLSSDDADNIICDGDQVIFTAGSGTNYEFRLNYVTVQNGAGTTYTTSTLNNGDAVKVIVTNGNGCIDSTAAITTTVNALPTPTLSSDDADNIICDGDQVIFTAGGGTNYEFRLNYVTVQNGAGTTYTTTTLNNSDAVKVIVTNANGCVDSTTAITTTVNILPVPGLSSNALGNEICQGDEVIFTASGGTNYDFKLNNIIVQSGVGITYTTTSLNNNDSIKVIVGNVNGCIDSSVAITTTVNSIPTVNDLSDTTVCNSYTLVPITGTDLTGDEAYYTGVGGTGTRYNAGDAITSSTTLYIFDSTTTTPSCSSEESFNISIYPVVDISPSATEISCAVTSITLDGSASAVPGTIAYLWSTADGQITGGTTTATTTIETAGTYRLDITDTDNGCTNYETVVITQSAGVPVVDISPSATEISCAVTNITLDGSASTVPGTIAYVWSTADGQITGGTTTATTTIEKAGTYRLDITDTDNGCTSYENVVITQSATVPNVDISPSATELTCALTSITLDGSASTVPGTIAYLWSTADGNITGGTTTATTTIDKFGTYRLDITDTDNSCTSYETVVITQSTDVPIVDLTPSATELTCGNTTITLDASGSTVIGTISYLWSTTDGRIVGSTTGVTATIDAPGTYRLDITDTDNSCTDYTTVVITQAGNVPLVDISPSATELTCALTSITLDGSASTVPGTISYLWSTADGQITGGTTTATTTIETAGTYRLDITDTDNGCTNYETVVITQSADVPVVDISPSATEITCAVTSITLDGSASTVPGTISYLWSTVDGQITGGTTTATTTIETAGTYRLDITNTDNGCTSYETVVITQSAAVPVVDISPSATEITCAVTSITLDGSASTVPGTISYLWSTVDGQITGGTTTATATIEKAGTYRLDITDTDNSCSSYSTIEISEAASVPVVDISSSANEIGCNVPSITLDGSGSSVQGTISYLWSTSDGVITGETDTETTTLNSPGTYLLEVTDQDISCSNTAQVIITQSSEICDINVDFEVDDSTICLNNTVVFTNTSTGTSAGATYNWNFGNGASPSTANGNGPHTVTYSTIGTKTVSLTVTNSIIETETKNNIITVLNGVPADAGIITGVGRICNGETEEYSVPEIANAESYVWNYSGTGAVFSSNTNQVSIEFGMDATSGVLTVQGVNSCGSGTQSPDYEITAFGMIADAGEIMGPEAICPGDTSVIFWIEPVTNAERYFWDYRGTGHNITGTSESITIDFSSEATEGVLSVYPINEYCQQEGGTSPYFDIVFNSQEECVGNQLPPVTNTFTPNGDNFNETWIIEDIELYPEAKIEVFDRWGRRVFFMEGGYSNANGWEGNFNGKALPYDNYFYVIDLFDNGKTILKGNLTLIK